MATRLQVTDGDEVWEPCTGQGDLIDAVLKVNQRIRIRASEMDSDAVESLATKYADNPRVVVVQEDALDVTCRSLSDRVGTFDRIISNPPYGAYQTPERRAMLKRRYPSMYVKESYGIILYHALEVLKPGGRLVFIVPDTFLWLHRHEALRRALVTQHTIHEIALFPSHFFPGIRFGYSGLCILTLEKRQPDSAHRIRIACDLSGPQVLLRLAEDTVPVQDCAMIDVDQGAMSQREHCELHTPNVNAVIPLGPRASHSLADVAEVRTGFYSGNDRRWVRRAHAEVPRSRHFLDVPSEMVFAGESPSLSGQKEGQHFVPIVRGGAAPFVRPTHWYVDWSVRAVEEYTRPGKNPARFQNSRFYFCHGMGVPMVASGRMTAALLEGRLFDQGIVGVFPRDESLMLYLLGFLNTSLATKLLRGINPTANNSANYLKRLPMAVPTSDELCHINMLVHRAIDETRKGQPLSAELQQDMENAYRKIWCDDEGHDRFSTDPATGTRLPAFSRCPRLPPVEASGK